MHNQKHNIEEAVTELMSAKNASEIQELLKQYIEEQEGKEYLDYISQNKSKSYFNIDLAKLPEKIISETEAIDLLLQYNLFKQAIPSYTKTHSIISELDFNTALNKMEGALKGQNYYVTVFNITKDYPECPEQLYNFIIDQNLQPRIALLLIDNKFTRFYNTDELIEAAILQLLMATNLEEIAYTLSSEDYNYNTILSDLNSNKAFQNNRINALSLLAAYNKFNSKDLEQYAKVHNIEFAISVVASEEGKNASEEAQESAKISKPHEQISLFIKVLYRYMELLQKLGLSGLAKLIDNKFSEKANWKTLQNERKAQSQTQNNVTTK